MEAQRGNWRAARWRDLAQRRYDQARALRRLTGCVEEVVALVSDPRSAIHQAGAPAEPTRTAIADALTATAAMLRSTEEGTDDEARRDSWAAADASVRRLAEQVSRLHPGPHDLYLTAAAITVALQRAVSAWA
jgi:hypothetical protein